MSKATTYTAKNGHTATFALGKEPVDTSRREQSVAAADIIITSSDIDGEQTEYPQAIHIDLTAFGHTGPLAGKPYSDALIQALTGVADTNGQEGGGPFVAGAPILEYEAAIYGAAAALAALRVRRLGGRTSPPMSRSLTAGSIPCRPICRRITTGKSRFAKATGILSLSRGTASQRAMVTS